MPYSDTGRRSPAHQSREQSDLHTPRESNLTITPPAVQDNAARRLSIPRLDTTTPEFEKLWRDVGRKQGRFHADEIVSFVYDEYERPFFTLSPYTLDRELYSAGMLNLLALADAQDLAMLSRVPEGFTRATSVADRFPFVATGANPLTFVSLIRGALTRSFHGTRFVRLYFEKHDQAELYHWEELTAFERRKVLAAYGVTSPYKGLSQQQRSRLAAVLEEERAATILGGFIQTWSRIIPNTEEGEE